MFYFRIAGRNIPEGIQKANFSIRFHEKKHINRLTDFQLFVWRNGGHQVDVLEVLGMY